MRTSPPVRILLVDDAGDHRLVLRILLEESGFDVVAEAADGDQAVCEAALHQPDIVLLDLAMPRADGLSRLPYLRQVAPGARVVVLSGAATATDVAAAGVLADRLIPKGVRTEVLLAELEAEVRALGQPAA